MSGSGKAKEDSDIEKIVMILTGTGMIVVASTCFKEIPFMGTVFLIPGDSIFKAKMTDPVIRYALFLIGGLLAAYGIQQIMLGFCKALKESRETAVPGKPASRRKPWRKTLGAGLMTVYGRISHDDDEYPIHKGGSR